MMLDQQIPMEKAFTSPDVLRERLGHDLDAHELAAYDPDELVAIFSTPPALHRFPAAMAKRAQVAVPDRGRPLRRRRRRDLDHGRHRHGAGPPAAASCPGFGPQKAKMFAALLGKQLGARPKGWRESSAPYGAAGTFISVADVVDRASLAKVKAHKKETKAAAKARVVTTTVLTGIALLATQDDELGEMTDAALVLDGDRIAWVGRGRRRPGRRSGRRPRRTGGAARLRRLARAPGLRRRPGRRVRRPDGGRSPTRPAASGPRWPRPGPRATTPLRGQRRPAGRASCCTPASPPSRPSPGTASTSTPRPARCAWPASSPPRRPSSARMSCPTGIDRACYLDAGHRADARRLRTARPLGRRVLRPRRVRRRRGPRRS